MIKDSDKISVQAEGKWKREIRMILLLLFNIISASIIGTLALCGAYSLPTTPIDRNVKASVAVLSSEGIYPILYDWCTSKLDNATDAVMLLEAANNYDVDSIQKAMLNYRGKIEGKTSFDTLIAHYENGTDFTDNVTYPRYWHGYHIWLKPLLCFFDYQAIRIINCIFQVAIGICICYTLFKKKKVEYIIPVVLTYGMLMPIALAKSLQFSSCYYIAALSVLLLLHTSKNKARYVFLYAGVLTAYFDFLTYPIATFGIPAVMYYSLYKDDRLKEKLLKLIGFGFCWSLGYIGMWGLKWFIGGIIAGVNIFEDAQGAIQFRISRSYNGTNFTILNCISTCLHLFFKTPCSYFVCGYCLWKSILTVKNWGKSHVSIKGCLDICIPLALLAFLPLLWYAVALNHSSIHDYFTNKALSVSVFALMMMFTNIACSKKRALILNI